ncbi:MAG: endonuclease MutS2 [Clostridia bacterium]|nr:endonuclease MutS2 [Clostridia bacterium]
MNDNERFSKAAVTLQFQSILTMLSECATTDGAKQLCMQTEPTDGLARIEALQNETADAARLYVNKGEPSFGFVKDVTPLVDRAEKGSMLSARELLDCANVLRTVRGVSEYYKTDRKYETCLDEVFERLLPDRDLERRITSAIISEEMIADDASPALSEIRRKIRNANNKIRETLQKFITGDAYSKYLQENIITLRNGRYVIPVKAEYRNEVKGLVHDTSSSGATLFIEPVAAVDANNELKVLERAEQTEIEKILYDFSSQIAERAEQIKLDYMNLICLSYAFARGKLAIRMDAVKPVYTEKRQIVLKRARHPLLDRAKVVPIDVTLGGDFDTLVITGPNTGGKTVSEKTVGLLVMMAQAGLHIPCAEGSSLCVFDGIMADIGDEQSIEQSLSTFSSHMVNIVDMLGSITDKTLVIFDELGAGTDPVEGAALAVSILEEVRELGALCMATTHYAELKAYAVETPGVTNASCEFDIDTLRPTYRLIIGAPGRSNAFAIAQRLGLPKHVIDRAQSSVHSDSKRFENVISKLEEQRNAMTAAREEAENAKLRAEEYAQAQRAAADEALEKAEKELQKAKEQSRRTVESARASAEFIYAELDRANKKKSKEERAAALAASRQGIREKLDEYDSTASEEVDDGYVLPRMPQIGETVYIKKLKTNAVVRSAPDKNGAVAVESGMLKMKVALSDIRIGDEYTKRKTDAKKEKPAVKESAPRTISSEIDLRGMNGEEAWVVVDRYIDDAIVCRLGQVSLIHGKGTGKLRELLRAQLKKDPRVAGFRDGAWGEGDNGVTVVKLK